MELDDRKLKILAAIIDEYIKTGEPVGSKTLMNVSGLNVSSATIRNDMALLEKMGFVEQPHTSAGRVPTYMGYRLYIDKLMSPYVLTDKEKKDIDSKIAGQSYTAQTVIDNAVSALSDLTELAVVNTSFAPKFSVITRVEVIPAGKRLYALLIITSSGDIKNKICRVEFDLTDEQLGFFGEFINKNLHGINIDKLNPASFQNLAMALGSYMITLSPLLYAVYELSEEFQKNNVNLKGERLLLEKNDFDSAEIIKFLDEKQELANMLNGALSDINIVFGKENDRFAISNSSMIITPYKMGDTPVGSLGVIGPLRLDYKSVIPYMRYFSDSVTRLLNNLIENDDER